MTFKDVYVHAYVYMPIQRGICTGTPRYLAPFILIYSTRRLTFQVNDWYQEEAMWLLEFKMIVIVVTTLDWPLVIIKMTIVL